MFFVAFPVDLNVLQIGVGRMNFRNTVQLREQNLKGKAAIETCWNVSKYRTKSTGLQTNSMATVLDITKATTATILYGWSCLV